MGTYNKKILLSIIIPCYNEEKILKNSCKKLFEFLNKKPYEFEIVLVDDGSKDNTLKIIKKLSQNNNKIKYVTYKKNKGKGFAIKQGLKKAMGDYFLFMDADISTDLIFIDIFFKKMLNSSRLDLIIGSRALPESRIITRQPKLREILGKMGNAFIRFYLKIPFKDTQCGFKLFNKKIKDLILKYSEINGFAFDIELIFLAMQNNLKIIDHPVEWKNNPNTKVKLFHYFSTLKDVIFIKFKK